MATLNLPKNAINSQKKGIKMTETTEIIMGALLGIIIICSCLAAVIGFAKGIFKIMNNESYHQMDRQQRKKALKPMIKKSGRFLLIAVIAFMLLIVLSIFF